MDIRIDRLWLPNDRAQRLRVGEVRRSALRLSEGRLALWWVRVPTSGPSGPMCATIPSPRQTPALLHLWGLESGQADGQWEVLRPHLVAVVGAAAPSLCCPPDLRWLASLRRRLVSAVS